MSSTISLFIYFSTSFLSLSFSLFFFILFSLSYSLSLPLNFLHHLFFPLLSSLLPSLSPSSLSLSLAHFHYSSLFLPVFISFSISFLTFFFFLLSHHDLFHHRTNFVDRKFCRGKNLLRQILSRSVSLL